MDDDRLIPGGRRGTPLYDRAGTILVAGVFVLLAGVLQLAIGALFLAVADDLAEALVVSESSVRKFAIAVMVLGVLALVVGTGVLKVRRWARVCALLYGSVALLDLVLRVAITRNPRYLLQPYLPALVVVLLLMPGVGAAFRQAAEERRLRRAAAPRPGVLARAAR
ncbi:MAG TPA: hypothetical protein VF519_09835 [Mycobacteriales bacterium]|jgi:uncharacterized membrane protein (DUF2068 family)